MKRIDLTSFLYVLFVGMFVVTFCVAIGALLKLHAFDAVEDKYRDRLFWLLIAEIAVIGVDLFRRLPPPIPAQSDAMTFKSLTPITLKTSRTH